MVTVAVTYPLNREDAVNATYVRKVRDVIARINRQRERASERASEPRRRYCQIVAARNLIIFCIYIRKVNVNSRFFPLDHFELANKTKNPCCVCRGEEWRIICRDAPRVWRETTQHGRNVLSAEFLQVHDRFAYFAYICIYFYRFTCEIKLMLI